MTSLLGERRATGEKRRCVTDVTDIIVILEVSCAAFRWPTVVLERLGAYGGTARSCFGRKPIKLTMMGFRTVFGVNMTSQLACGTNPATFAPLICLLYLFVTSPCIGYVSMAPRPPTQFGH